MADSAYCFFVLSSRVALKLRYEVVRKMHDVFASGARICNFVFKFPSKKFLVPNFVLMGENFRTKFFFWQAKI